MFTPVLLSFAIAASPASVDPITINQDAPTIVIPLARYNLGQPSDVRRLKWRIVTAAKLVCDNGQRGVRHREAVACVKSATADANAQLSRMIAENSPASALTSAIGVVARP